MSYVNVLIHAVIRTYKSEQSLPEDDKITTLYRIIWGILKNRGCYLYRINSMPDHVHLLFSMSKNLSVPKIMQAVKGISSKLIKDKEGFEHFVAWGRGYAALSKCVYDKQVIINYIINQQKHHRKQKFKDEYVSMIKKMGQEFDERDWEN